MKYKFYSNFTRFAPSPTGHLHLGHIFSAFFAFEASKILGGEFIVRIEDIDPQRSRAHFEKSIFDDLDWIGIKYRKDIRRQSEKMSDYKAAIEELDRLNIIYPCFCTRSEIQAEILRAGNAPHGIDHSIYPGTCRRLSKSEKEKKIKQNKNFAWRINIRAAAKKVGKLFWNDIRLGQHEVPVGIIGDVVIGRKDVPASYHLASTLDDHLQNIGLVSRGEDLVESTHIHRLLQSLLGLKTPVYFHHPLVLDSNGVRLSKRTRALTIKSMKAKGKSANEIINLFGKNNLLSLLSLIKPK